MTTPVSVVDSEYTRDSVRWCQHYDAWQHCIDWLQHVLAAAWRVIARVQSTVAREGRLWNHLCCIDLATRHLCRVCRYCCDTAAVSRLSSHHHQRYSLSLLHFAGSRVTSQNNANRPCNAGFSLNTRFLVTVVTLLINTASSLAMGNNNNNHHHHKFIFFFFLLFVIANVLKIIRLQTIRNFWRFVDYAFCCSCNSVISCFLVLGDPDEP